MGIIPIATHKGEVHTALPKPEPSLKDKILDANNRFRVLFDHLDEGDSQDFAPKEPIKFRSPVFPTEAQRKYATAAENNRTRIRLGYPLKGTASTDSEEYRTIKSANDRLDHSGKLKEIIRNLSLFRTEGLQRYKAGRGDPPIVPLSCLEAYEQWVTKALELGLVPPALPSPAPECDVPRVWDNHPIYKSGVGVNIFVDPGG